MGRRADGGESPKAIPDAKVKIAIRTLLLHGWKLVKLLDEHGRRPKPPFASYALAQDGRPPVIFLLRSQLPWRVWFLPRVWRKKPELIVS